MTMNAMGPDQECVEDESFEDLEKIMVEDIKGDQLLHLPNLLPTSAHNSENTSYYRVF